MNNYHIANKNKTVIKEKPIMILIKKKVAKKWIY